MRGTRCPRHRGDHVVVGVCLLDQVLDLARDRASALLHGFEQARLGVAADDDADLGPLALRHFLDAAPALSLQNRWPFHFLLTSACRDSLLPTF